MVNLCLCNIIHTYQLPSDPWEGGIWFCWRNFRTIPGSVILFVCVSKEGLMNCIRNSDTNSSPHFPSLAWSAFIDIRRMTDVSGSSFHAYKCLGGPGALRKPVAVEIANVEWVRAGFPPSTRSQAGQLQSQRSFTSISVGRRDGDRARSPVCWPSCGQDVCASQGQAVVGDLGQKRLCCWEAENLAIGNWEVWEDQDTFPGRPVCPKGL